MKFLVDTLPETPEECPMHTIKETCIPTCRLTNDLYFECKIGDKAFECPYLSQFKALAIKQHYVADSVVGITKIPVYLGEE